MSATENEGSIALDRKNDARNSFQKALVISPDDRAARQGISDAR